MNDDDLDLKKAQRKIFEQSESAMTLAAGELGLSPEELTDLVQNAKVRPSADCLKLADLVNIEALREARRDHVTQCAFCTSVLEAMNEPPIPARREEFIADVHLSQTTELAHQSWLVVEENTATRNVLRQILENAGATVETAASDTEGTQKAKRVQPDMVLGMAPSKVRQVMKHAFKSIDLCVSEQEGLESVRAGFDAYVFKPVSASKLIKTASGLRKGLRSDRSEQRD